MGVSQKPLFAPGPLLVLEHDCVVAQLIVEDHRKVSSTELKRRIFQPLRP
jgi:hypothetical protein